MCESFTPGIEHPNQDTWLAGYSVRLSPEQKAAIGERYAELPPETINLAELFGAIDSATITNRAHRHTHETGSQGLLGIGAKGDEGEPGKRRNEYDQFTGRADKVSDFIQWFSRISHAAFIAQERPTSQKRFEHVSLELGGTPQFGDWEATKVLDSMARSIPAGVLAKIPDASMTVYGFPKDGHIEDERITYVEDEKKSYSLLPTFVAAPTRRESGTPEIKKLNGHRVYFDYTSVRRRRPVADIYIPGQSDLVIFKESIGLLVMSMIDPEISQEILTDTQRIFDNALTTRMKGRVKLDDTLGARLAGALFEDAITSRAGITKHIHPISAHYVQGVGKKFARFRTEFND